MSLRLPPPPHPSGSIFRSLRRLGLTAVLAAAALVPSWAYSPSGAPNPRPPDFNRDVEGLTIGPILFSPSIYTETAYDDNIFRVEDGFQVAVDPNHDGTLDILTQKAQGDFISTTRARLAWKLPFSHSYVSLVWLPQYRQYASLKAPLSFSQQMNFETALNFSNGSTVHIQDDLDRGFFQARRLDELRGFQLSATPYRRNRSSVDYDWSSAMAWGFAGKVERIDFQYDRTQVVDFSDTASGTSGSESRLFDFFDYVTHSIESRVYHNFSRFQVYLSGTLARTDQDRSKFNSSQLESNGCNTSLPPSPETCTRLRALIDSERIDQTEAAVGIRGALTAATRTDFKIGYTSWTFKNGSARPFAGISVNGSFEHAFDRRTLAVLNLQRVPVQATGQYTGYYTRQEGSITIDRKLTMRLSGRARLAFRLTDFPGEEALDFPRFTLKDYEGSLELRYRPGMPSRPGPLVLSLAYAPTRSTSSFRDAGLDTSTQRVVLSLQYGWF